MSVHLLRFMEHSGVLPTTQFAYQKGLGACDALLCMFHTPETALKNVQQARIMQIDFSAAFDIVNHQSFLYKLCSVGIGGSILTYLDTWSGFEAAKTAPWPSLGLHHFGKLFEPSDELAGQRCCCFLMWYYSWAYFGPSGMSSLNLSSSNLNFSVLTLSMSLRYFGNELHN